MSPLLTNSRDTKFGNSQSGRYVTRAECDPTTFHILTCRRCTYKVKHCIIYRYNRRFSVCLDPREVNVGMNFSSFVENKRDVKVNRVPLVQIPLSFFLLSRLSFFSKLPFTRLELLLEQISPTFVQ